MCGRYAIYTAPQRLADLFGLTNEVDAGGRYNAAPLQDLPIIIHNLMGVARWGLLPPTAAADNRLLCAKMINARAETVAEKPAFRESWLKKRRCLIPADGFYEWVTDEAARARQPYFITRKDHEPLAMAGLWAKTGDLVTFTILTKDADGPAAALHHRLPVMVPVVRAGDWFMADADGAQALIAESHGADLQYRPVNPAVGQVANDYESLLDDYEISVTPMLAF